MNKEESNQMYIVLPKYMLFDVIAISIDYNNRENTIKQVRLKVIEEDMNMVGLLITYGFVDEIKNEQQGYTFLDKIYKNKV